MPSDLALPVRFFNITTSIIIQKNYLFKIKKGPGAYDVRDFKEPEKKYMSSAVFVSSTGRWINNNTGKNLPGPANYSPAKITKQSFHCNF